MTTETGPEPTPPREMTCLRRLYVMEDDAGGTWLAAEEEPTEGSDAEGGSMSHRTALGGRGGSMSHRPSEPEGGSMSHFGPGDKGEVEGDDPDQVTVLLPSGSGGSPRRLRAYRVSRALLPTGEGSTDS